MRVHLVDPGVPTGCQPAERPRAVERHVGHLAALRVAHADDDEVRLGVRRVGEEGVVRQELRRAGRR